jgi:two-component system nitrogen regulation sensor histidine kinase NtrY
LVFCSCLMLPEYFTNQAKRRRTLTLAALGAIVFALLLFLVLLQSSQLWKSFAVDTASETLTLYALTSLNFFALIIFAFIFLRSVVRLVRERRALKLGAKLKTRLLVYFVAISLLPITAMATFSYLFLNRALEKWFSRLPENVINEAREIQRNAIAEQLAKLSEKARLMAVIVESESALNEQNLQNALESGNLAAIELNAPDNSILMRVERSDLPAAQAEELRQTWRKIREPENADKSLQDGIGFDAAAVPLADGRVLRVISNWRDEKNVSAEILSSGSEFERLKRRQAETRQLGFSVLSLLTFLLIFAASWVALHLGRSLTEPIRAIALASEEVKRGNLNYKIDVLAEDELALLVKSFNQMTAQLAANRQTLEERRNYIEVVLQSLSTGVVSFDTENRVTTINEAARGILRLGQIDSENKRLDEILDGENRLIIEKLLARARRAGHATEQTVLFAANGTTTEKASLPVALTATALPREQFGGGRGAVLVIEDLTELLAAQRAAAWSEVARRMAHEIKNPLTPIQLAAERIAKRFETNGNPQLAKIVAQSTETILREVSSLKAMVDEFSQFARLPSAKPESKDLNEIVRQTVLLYEDRLDGAQLEINLAKNLPRTLIDAEQMRRVFVNLIDNAIEAFAPEQINKRISIKTWHDAESDLIFAEVADNGRGIPAKDFAKLFQPYFSTKGRGTGLGLAIVRRIVSEHGGRIRIAANSPCGAKFIIEFAAANT